MFLSWNLELLEFGTLTSEAQRAFVKYVTDEESNLNNYRVFVKLAKSLNVEVLPDIGDSVTAALDLATEMEENQQLPNVSNLERSGTEELAILINQAFRDDPNSKEILLNVLRMEEPQLPVKSLLSKDSFSFIKLIDSSLTDDHKIRLFGLLRDPIVPVIRQISRNVSPYKEFEWLQEQIDIFSELTIDNREAILQHLAISTYRADGEYSLDPIRLLIFQARSLNYWVAFLCSTILMLPIGIISILLGSLLGRSLVEKDRIQDLVIIEKAGQRDYTSTYNIGIPVDLQGREALIQRLQKLSGRGWSTIAVVGRRGIGKSRVLYEIYKNKSSEMTGFGVSAWISSPSQYTEDEFIESTLEQLALNTEQSIAYYLGAEPFSVRKLKALVTKSGLTVFFVSVCFLVLLLVVIYLRLQRPEVMITWSPILVIISASFFCLVRHLSQAQPVDLSPWLESDRMFSPHTVLLYRSVQQVFDYIDFRKERLVIRNKNSAPLSRIISSAIAGFPIAFSATIIISAWPPYGQYAGFVFVFSWVLSSIFFYKLIGRDKRSGRGSNLMALVSTYREFASTVVYRLDQGALGKTGKDSVMICIDELDKIIDLNSLRDFLRRMKGIFEVPGVYYYLSLSEDALSALYLGTAEGKNEVDSSLDHIVRISPLPWKKSHELAVAYLQRRGFSKIDSSVSSALASASFGIPRDILRRVDEFLARKDYISESSSSAIAEIRREQSELTIESYSWPRGWYEKISKEPIASSKNLERIIKGIDTNEDAVGERGVRSLVLVWVLCMIEISMEFPSSERDSFLKTLHDFGYQISRIPLSDLFLAIEDLKAQFKSSMYLNGSA